MLIPFSELFAKYNIKPKGVLHVGASTGQEAEAYYKAGIEHTIWIEPIEEVYNKLIKHIHKFPFKKKHVFNLLIGDVDNEIVKFNIANNEGQSSSMFDFGTHTKEHPTVKFTDSVTMQTLRLDTIIKNGNTIFDIKDYDFLNVDVQGAELKVLKGMGEYLHGFKWIYLEVNKAELYRGCPMVEELDEYVKPFGFERMETKWTGAGWGDAYYQKSK